MVSQVTQPDLFGNSLLAGPARGTGLYADIVFDRPIDQAYTYAVPEDLRATVGVGKRVLAPFGRGERVTAGYCVGVNQTEPTREVKELRRVLDDEVLLTSDLLRLTRWIADYYLCGWGQVLNAVVPAGAKEQAGTRAIGFLEPVPEAELPQPPPTLTAKQQAALDLLRAAGQPVEPQVLARRLGCGPGPVDALVVKRVARRLVRRMDRFTRTTEAEPSSEAPVTLNPDQLTAWAPLEQALARGSPASGRRQSPVAGGREPAGFHAFLLYGVTGSGKTEIYLRAIEEVVRQGKEAIVLVPEISLTPQTIQRFQGRCGEVAVLHSHLGNAERGGQWRRVARGEVHVVVGARSAVFAPTRRLGLIVIDEEHEGSFKQESTPRYHARDVAVMRARLENVPIILGSATPSLESWHNAERGQYTLLRLPNRVLDRPLPTVKLIDLRHEVPASGGRQHPVRGRFRALSPTLERALRDTLREGGQAMLLLNRRGFSTHVHCPACGHVETCRFCDLALTFHRQREVLLCHYCGYEQAPPERCAECRQAAVRYYGLGTEKLETEIQEMFPNFVVRRMDSDSMKRPGSHGRVLAAFRKGLIHILLGTQMIAKGLDFPNVTFVGVVNADIGLHVPDFRSSERTFQLLSQVAGRTGRGPRGGKVWIQTYNPEHPSITLAAAHDYEKFAELEMAHRQGHNYPPFNRLVRLIVRSREQEAGALFTERLAAGFTRGLERSPKIAAAGIRILGPAEAPVFRLKGYYRYHFQLQSASAAALHQLVRTVLPAVRPSTGVEFTLDVDPLNML
jgi:primosomal protein N' (replication factor Y)